MESLLVHSSSLTLSHLRLASEIFEKEKNKKKEEILLSHNMAGFFTDNQKVLIKDPGILLRK